jgi:parallel beta-helix repeat protein
MRIGTTFGAAASGIMLGGAVIVVAGPLNPPAGPVSPTHKTLSEIEPRIVLSDATTPGDVDSFYKITQPGSYYLDRSYQFVLGNIGSKSAIEVDADHVTIDLRGFSLRAINNARHAIQINAGISNVRIVNGHLDNFGLGGVSGPGAMGVVVEDVTVSDCGFGQDPGAPGIELGEPAGVRRCTLTRIGSAARPHPGIRLGDDAAVEGCTVSLCTAGGVIVTAGALVTDTACTFNTGEGFRMAEGGTLSRCTAGDNTNNGMVVTGGAVTNLGGTNVSDCTASRNGGFGILTVTSTVTGCMAIGNTQAGFSSVNSAVNNCVSRSNTTHGFIGSNTTFIACMTRTNTQDGFSAGEGTLIKDCLSRGNSSDGIEAQKEVTIVGCHLEDNGIGTGTGAGIRLTQNDNRVEGNTIVGNLAGGIVAGAGATGNVVVANRASNNGAPGNYSIVAGNVVGTVVATEAAMNAAANSLVNVSF